LSLYQATDYVRGATARMARRTASGPVWAPDRADMGLNSQTVKESCLPPFSLQVTTEPPSTAMVWAVTKSLWPEARKISAPTRSAGVSLRGMARVWMVRSA